MTAPDVITIECDQKDCAYTVTAAPSGPNSAKMQIGRHKFGKHGIRGVKARKGARPTSDELAENPVRILRSVAETAAGRGAPTEAKLTEAIGEGLSLTSIAVAAYFAETDPSIPRGIEGEQDRDDVVQNLTLGQEAAEALAHPIAKALAPTSLNRKYGRGVVDNVGVLGSALDIYRLFLRYRMYFEIRREATPRVSAAAPRSAVQAAAPAAVPAGDAGGGPPPAFVPPAQVYEAANPQYLPQLPMNVTPDIPADYVPIVPGGHVVSAHEIRR